MENNEKLAEIRNTLKELLVSNLSLEDVDPKEIKDDEILFGEGLGLDSLDAVEIVVILQRHFDLDVKDMQKERDAFYSIETLAKYVLDKKNAKSEDSDV